MEKKDFNETINKAYNKVIKIAKDDHLYSYQKKELLEVCEILSDVEPHKAMCNTCAFFKSKKNKSTCELKKIPKSSKRDASGKNFGCIYHSSL